MATRIRKLLLLPAFVAMAFVTIIPVGFTIFAAFSDWHLYNYDQPINFVGLGNFAKLLTDKNFIVALRNTVIFAVVAAPLEYAIGLAVAVGLDSINLGKRFFRVTFWLPLMMSSVLITVIVGRMMYEPLVGPLNEMLSWVGIGAVQWLADRRIAMTSVLIVDIWRSTPFIIMMMLAALESLPEELNDAAAVDGATDWQLFWRITFPMLAPVSASVFLIRLVDAWKVLDIINVLTGGGPGRSTQSISLLIYQLGVRGGALAYASAIAWALTIFIAISAGIVFYSTRRFLY